MKNELFLHLKLGGYVTASNQIRVVAFMSTTLDTSFIFTKKSNVAKWFFDICNDNIEQSCQKLNYILEIK